MQPKREMERSLEALNQLDPSQSDSTKRSRVSDGSQKEALVMILNYFLVIHRSFNLIKQGSTIHMKH